MIGQTISHYEITEALGRGGMGVVYKARDLRLDRFVALKFLPRSIEAQEEEKQRFIVEAKAASALDHPNICTIHEIDQTDDGQMFIVMGYYPGSTLQERIAQGPLPAREAVEIAAQIGQGLSKACKEGIVHRDIKPANVIVTTDGIVKILDFGLARLAGQTKMTVPGTRLGTASYMSPEQASGEPLDHRADIWSLGVVLYEMLSGRRPFEGHHELAVIYSIVHEAPEPLRNEWSSISPSVEEIVHKALAKKPADRYQHIEEMIADLRAATPTMPAEETKLHAAEQTRPSRPVKGLYVAAAVGVLVLVAGLAYLTRGTDSGDPVAQTPVASGDLPAQAPTIPALPSAGEPDLSVPVPATSPPRNEPPPAAAPQPTIRPSPRRTNSPPPTPAPARQRMEKSPNATAAASPVPETTPPVTPDTGPTEPVEKAERQTSATTPQAAPRPPVNGRILEVSEWSRIRGSNNVTDFEEFLRSFPNGALRQDALRRIEDLKWQQARRSREPSALDRYLLEYPRGRYVSQARTLLAELQLAPAPVPTTPGAPTPAAPVVDDASRIRETLRRLSEAYEQKDVTLVAALWPTLTANQVQTLANSFRIARSIGYELQPLGRPVFSNGAATVRCKRVVTFEDNRGPQAPVESEVTVELRKRDGSWVIEDVQ